MKTLTIFALIFIALFVSSVEIQAQNEKYEAMDVKNFDRKYKKACRNVFLYYEKDDFNNSVNCETHKLVLENEEANQDLVMTLKRDSKGYYMRIFDSKNDIRMFDTCKVKLRGEMVFDLIKEKIGGDEMTGGGYRKDFIITREQLKLIQQQGLIAVRLIRVGLFDPVDYIVPANQSHITEYVIDCLTIVK